MPFPKYLSVSYLTKLLEQTKTLISSLAITLISISLILVVVRQLINSAIIIEPIQVPKSFEDLGLSPQVTAQWLMDDMLLIQQTATTRKQGQAFAPQWQYLDMEVPGSGFSVKTIGSVVRESLGMTERKISGEIININNRYQVHMRLVGSAQSPSKISVDSSEMPTLFAHAAELAVQQIDPFMYASYLYATERTTELASAIDVSLRYGPAKERSWSYNLLGISASDQGQDDIAEEYYQQAIALDEDFALAYYNLSNLRYKQNRFAQTLSLYQQAISLDNSLRDDKKEAGIRFNLANILAQDSSTLQQALNMYNLAWQQEKNQPQLLLRWGIALTRLAKPNYHAAIDKFKQQAEQSPLDAQNYLQWGDALKNLGQCDDAIIQYEQLKQIDPEGYQTIAELRIEQTHTQC